VVVGSNLQVEVGKKSGHSFWAKYREASEVIELNGLISDYWSLNDHAFTVMSQSSSSTSQRITSDERTAGVVIGRNSGSLEVQFSINDTVRTFSIAHPANS